VRGDTIEITVKRLHINFQMCAAWVLPSISRRASRMGKALWISSIGLIVPRLFCCMIDSNQFSSGRQQFVIGVEVKFAGWRNGK